MSCDALEPSIFFLLFQYSGFELIQMSQNIANLIYTLPQNPFLYILTNIAFMTHRSFLLFTFMHL